ncbi:alpha/beta hydrolase [Microbacterium esteraromaticum]|uniref:alpha/beta hydrolase n=1 Tax=Microbacterium esteraromaticum TaxID=57043 RepID=UPI001CD2107C|nr:alpha/beta hydrolase [Microbacterium esteraromaticum]MCA1307949.1 alpha/beta hydrolase [Microbacterium esteraromaticum]
MGEWIPDILGDGFEQQTLPLGEDSEGELVATVVRSLPEAPRWWHPLIGHRDRRPLADVDVLYVHGWSDYFFNRRLARFWTDRGARFYALDLRKYGRSLRPGQTPGFITDLAEYDADIGAALAARGDATGRRLVLLGHSTGGLTLSLWAARHAGDVAAVVLNAPWLEFQLSAARAAITPVVELQARFWPMDAAPQVDLGFYSRAQREVADPDDPLETNPEWRPEKAMTVHAAWLRAVFAGHDAVSRGLGITAPVCVLLSQRTVVPTRWSPELTRADSVLVVDDIAAAAVKLGSSVTVERIDGALHDVFISQKDARDESYARLARWVDGWSAQTA